MTDKPLFSAAFPFQQNVLALPVANLDDAASWYQSAFGMHVVERKHDPVPTIILQRDGVQIGFAVNDGDASQDGAAILVTDIRRAREELEANEIEIGDWRIEDRKGTNYQVFFVVAPDELCFYFHQLID